MIISYLFPHVIPNSQYDFRKTSLQDFRGWVELSCVDADDFERGMMLQFKLTNKKITSCSYNGITVDEISNGFTITYRRKTRHMGDGVDQFFNPDIGDAYYSGSWDWWMALGQDLVFRSQEYLEAYFQEEY